MGQDGFIDLGPVSNSKSEKKKKCLDLDLIRISNYSKLYEFSVICYRFYYKRYVINIFIIRLLLTYYIYN